MGETAIILAAGQGSRLKPLTDKIPKPLVKVKGTPMIETVINSLIHRKVSRICVVVGYLKEQFSYLVQKYGCVFLVENPEYKEKNNISSLYAAIDFLGDSDCFICEADLFISDCTVLDIEAEKSSYLGKYVSGHSEDWVFECDQEGRITRVGLDGTDTYNMVGISYFLQRDTVMLRTKIKEAYHDPKYDHSLWDEVIDHNLDIFDMRVIPVPRDAVIEIDTKEELDAIENGGGLC